MPEPVFNDSKPLPASYANFYIANGVVLVPVFADPSDPEALEILQHLFPDRRVIGIDCRDLIWGMGAIHCVTQQQPEQDPILLLRGLGQEISRDEDPNGYVRRLREGWQ